MTVSPEVMPSLWFGGFRNRQITELFRWSISYVEKGDQVWDIGANQGLFSFSAAAVAGPTGNVVAVEPDPFLMTLMLQTNGNQNQDMNAPVVLLSAAILNESVISELEISSFGRCLNRLNGVKGNPHFGVLRAKVSVPCISLDQLAQRYGSPNLIKIDVEGAEQKVLEGATCLLSERRPRLLIEVSREANEPITELLYAHNYELYDAGKPNQARVKSCTWNTFAVPRSI